MGLSQSSIWGCLKKEFLNPFNNPFLKSLMLTPFTMSHGSLRVRPEMISFRLHLMVVFSGGTCVISVNLQTNSSSRTPANKMVKSTVELASAMMLRLILTSSWLEVNKDIPFFAKEETTNLKCSGDSEKKVANILDPSMPSKETPSRKNTSSQLEIGPPKFGLKSWNYPSCKPVITILILLTVAGPPLALVFSSWQEWTVSWMFGTSFTDKTK